MNSPPPAPPDRDGGLFDRPPPREPPAPSSGQAFAQWPDWPHLKHSPLPPPPSPEPLATGSESSHSKKPHCALALLGQDLFVSRCLHDALTKNGAPCWPLLRLYCAQLRVDSHTSRCPVCHPVDAPEHRRFALMRWSSGVSVQGLPRETRRPIAESELSAHAAALTKNPQESSRGLRQV